MKRMEIHMATATALKRSAPKQLPPPNSDRSAPAAMRSTPMSTQQKRTLTGALRRQIASTSLPTKWGIFEAMGFERELWTVGRTAETALALVLGDLSQEVALLRVHVPGDHGEAPVADACFLQDGACAAWLKQARMAGALRAPF